MPSLTKHQSQRFTKMLLIGDSGSGKTGSLVSLVKAGYKLRILDFDNGLDSLVLQTRLHAPDKLDSIEYRSLRDKYKATALGAVVDGQPMAFRTSLEMLTNWKYKEPGFDPVDLGNPSAWGPEVVLVIDSLSMMSNAAMEFAKTLVVMGPKGQDGRAIYGEAQRAIEYVLQIITSDDFECNVVVIAHIRYMDSPEGGAKGYPQGPGEKLSPIIPRYFNSVAMCVTQSGGKRAITTVSNALVDLKNPAPHKMEKALDLSTGLATFFETVRGNK